MKKDELIKQLAYLLTDPVSLEIFKQPVATPCGHVFEAEALDDCFDAGMAECPECREKICEDDLRSVYLIDKVLELMFQAQPELRDDQYFSEKRFLEAVAFDDISSVKTTLKYKPSLINDSAAANKALLFFAIESNAVKVINYLLKQAELNLNIEEKTFNNVACPPLFYAYVHQQLETFQALLNADKIDVFQCNSDGVSLFELLMDEQPDKQSRKFNKQALKMLIQHVYSKDLPDIAVALLEIDQSALQFFLDECNKDIESDNPLPEAVLKVLIATPTLQEQIVNCAVGQRMTDLFKLSSLSELEFDNPHCQNIYNKFVKKLPRMTAVRPSQYGPMFQQLNQFNSPVMQDIDSLLTNYDAIIGQLSDPQDQQRKVKVIAVKEEFIQRLIDGEDAFHELHAIYSDCLNSLKDNQQYFDTLNKLINDTQDSNVKQACQELYTDLTEMHTEKADGNFPHDFSKNQTVISNSSIPSEIRAHERLLHYVARFTEYSHSENTELSIKAYCNNLVSAISQIFAQTASATAALSLIDKTYAAVTVEKVEYLAQTIASLQPDNQLQQRDAAIDRLNDELTDLVNFAHVNPLNIAHNVRAAFSTLEHRVHTFNQYDACFNSTLASLDELANKTTLSVAGNHTLQAYQKSLTDFYNQLTDSSARRVVLFDLNAALRIENALEQLQQKETPMCKVFIERFTEFTNSLKARRMPPADCAKHIEGKAEDLKAFLTYLETAMNTLECFKPQLQASILEDHVARLAAHYKPSTHDGEKLLTIELHAAAKLLFKLAAEQQVNSLKNAKKYNPIERKIMSALVKNLAVDFANVPPNKQAFEKHVKAAKRLAMAHYVTNPLKLLPNNKAYLKEDLDKIGPGVS